MEQLSRVKDLPVPEFGSLQAWEARASAAGRAINGDSGSNDLSRSSQGYGGTPMPFLGETKVRLQLYFSLMSNVRCNCLKCTNIYVILMLDFGMNL